MKNMCICTDTHVQISGCKEIVFELPLLQNKTESVTFLHE